MVLLRRDRGIFFEVSRRKVLYILVLLIICSEDNVYSFEFCKMARAGTTTVGIPYLVITTCWILSQILPVILKVERYCCEIDF
jgi:hypothetical protein